MVRARGGAHTHRGGGESRIGRRPSAAAVGLDGRAGAGRGGVLRPSSGVRVCVCVCIMLKRYGRAGGREDSLA